MSLSMENIIKRLLQARKGTVSNKSLIDYTENTRLGNEANRSQTYFVSLVENWPKHYNTEFEESNVFGISIVLLFYALIICMSLFGNSIVCKIVFAKPRTRSTTHLYIGNLSISDLMMTVINIPLQLTEIIIRNWPLGLVLCKCLHFIGSLSVCVSTLTMVFIALDRFQVIAYPLKPRPGMTATVHKLIFIWIAALSLSSPYALMSDLSKDFTYKSMIRCRMVYPAPKEEARKFFTIVSLAIQFIVPLVISVITYSRICLIIWQRRSIGLVTENQKKHLQLEKWKTIKMLIIVLVAFVACWLPLNIYHTYQDIRGEMNMDKHNSTVWWLCHWFAMSSVCCNPFIYCWLNDSFRKMAKEYLRRISEIGRKKPQQIVSSFLSPPYKESCLLSRSTSSSSKISSTSTQWKDAPYGTSEKQLPFPMSADMMNSKQNMIKLSKTVAKTMRNSSVSVEVYAPKDHQQRKSISRFFKRNTDLTSKEEAVV